MPPLPPVPNVFQVSLRGQVTATQPYNWANVLHWQWNGTSPTNSVCQSFANATWLLWSQHVSPLQSSQVSLDNVVYTDLSSNSGGVGNWAVHTPGTRGDEPNAANVATLISYGVGVRYRGGHPRTYLLGGQATDLADIAHWTGAYVTAAQTGWLAFLAGVLSLSNSGTGLASQVAVSYYDKEINPVPPYRRTTPLVLPIAVGAAEVQSEVASQRRRIGRRKK